MFTILATDHRDAMRTMIEATVREITAPELRENNPEPPEAEAA